LVILWLINLTSKHYLGAQVQHWQRSSDSLPAPLVVSLRVFPPFYWVEKEEKERKKKEKEVISKSS